MNLFINDIQVIILKSGQKLDKHSFNTIINAEHEPITLAKLLHRTWIKHAREEDVDKLLDVLDTATPHGVISLTLTVDDYQGVKAFVKKKFKVVKAAGGLVQKGGKFLMIYRMKKWDLPKGKLDPREKNKDAAKREVEEECNVEVKVKKKLCTTWHTYTMNRKKILKRTVWYTMSTIYHADMKPQLEEDIEELRWMTPKEVFHALQHSYKSIAFVVDSYFKKEKATEA
ncbi:NUDIX domain-containing protein [Fulvivirga sp. M361]|uniref:NUDIX domain-containing protein n=1 Tax=Fulvivirga sp. M361 TaxID=2594266 RepID=UPI00117AB795|nr:NUDIX domain-containing protein [Fulvivirga sp. M361]TRX49833.1 NUDIX domain-containing protein [Fulvivirga sp. M361]